MRLSKAMHYGEHSGCKNNIFFDSKINPEISRNYISEINRKSSFVPFLSLFREIPRRYACGMGRTNKRVRNYGRRQNEENHLHTRTAAAHLFPRTRTSPFRKFAQQTPRNPLPIIYPFALSTFRPFCFWHTAYCIPRT